MNVQDATDSKALTVLGPQNYALSLAVFAKQFLRFLSEDMVRKC